MASFARSFSDGASAAGAVPLSSDAAVTSPQLGALDRSDEFAAHRFFRLYPNQRLVADLWRRILRVSTRRKTDCGENDQRPHRYFPFAFRRLKTVIRDWIDATVRFNFLAMSRRVIPETMSLRN
jgi:hypothetical protein